jgi:hypothetical protein
MTARLPAVVLGSLSAAHDTLKARGANLLKPAATSILGSVQPTASNFSPRSGRVRPLAKAPQGTCQRTRRSDLMSWWESVKSRPMVR